MCMCKAEEKNKIKNEKLKRNVTAGSGLCFKCSGSNGDFGLIH